ncbi:MAG: AlpA family phage regulatory protein [Ideonella sp.]|nr:AlpA family phage regulatory protein [Ideonella sp.]MBE7425070.1 AlpA family phage regulatory protein [Ideonella sp.]
MDTFIRPAEMPSLIGLQRTAIHDSVRDETLTPPIQLSKRAVAFLSSEVAQVMDARIAGATPEQLRQLVRKLVAERASKMPKL